MKNFKIALGMINKNDKASLELYLPIVRPCFDGAIAVDAESTDGSQAVFSGWDFFTKTRPWNDNFADARNAVIKIAEELGYTHLFMLDSDECMFPEDIEVVKEYAKDREFVCLPRIEFIKDNQHFSPTMYPDYQGRVIKLGIFYHYQNKIHEMLWKGEDKVEARKVVTNYPLKIPNCPIYHYGRCKSAEFLWLKHQNYDRLTRGVPLLAEIPEGTVINETVLWGGKAVKFHGKQPI